MVSILRSRSSPPLAIVSRFLLRATFQRCGLAFVGISAIKEASENPVHYCSSFPPAIRLRKQTVRRQFIRRPASICAEIASRHALFVSMRPCYLLFRLGCLSAQRCVFDRPGLRYHNLFFLPDELANQLLISGIGGAGDCSDRRLLFGGFFS